MHIYNAARLWLVMLVSQHVCGLLGSLQIQSPVSGFTSLFTSAGYLLLQDTENKFHGLF